MKWSIFDVLYEYHSNNMYNDNKQNDGSEVMLANINDNKTGIQNINMESQKQKEKKTDQTWDIMDYIIRNPKKFVLLCAARDFSEKYKHLFDSILEDPRFMEHKIMEYTIGKPKNIEEEYDEVVGV